jgi:uncharacterized protein (DUF2147 family)
MMIGARAADRLPRGPIMFGLSMRTSAAALLATIALAALAGDDKESSIVGNWLTEPKDGIIQISLVAPSVYEGRIVGGNHPGRVDVMNPDLAQRDKPLGGQVILRHLHYGSDGKWSDGTIYDPDSGHTYKCVVELISPDTLKLRGFVGIPLLGKQQIWTRYKGTSMNLSAAR